MVRARARDRGGVGRRRETPRALPEAEKQRIVRLPNVLYIYIYIYTKYYTYIYIYILLLLLLL